MKTTINLCLNDFLNVNKINPNIVPSCMKFSRHLNFAILQKICILTHFNFTFLSETHFISLSMLFNVSLNLIKQLNQQCPNKQKRN